jgi:putative ABC transport system permease protein
MSYLVSLQTHEIGIRMALGARPGQVLRLVLSHGMKLALAGVILGVVGGLLLSRFLTSLLFAISPTDPVTYAAVSLFLLAMALTAAYVPARRASRVDPLVALRHE